MQKTVEARQQHIAKLMHETALLACPFKIGDTVFYKNRPQERFDITEIKFCWNKEGYRLVGRRHSVYGGLTLQYRDLRDLEFLQLQEDTQ